MKCCHFHPNPAALKSDILYVKPLVAPKPLANPPYFTGIGVVGGTGTAVTLFCGLPSTNLSE